MPHGNTETGDSNMSYPHPSLEPKSNLSYETKRKTNSYFNCKKSFFFFPKFLKIPNSQTANNINMAYASQQRLNYTSKAKLLIFRIEPRMSQENQ